MLGTEKVDAVNSNIVSNLWFIPRDNLFGKDFNIGGTWCKPWRMNVWNEIQILHVTQFYADWKKYVKGVGLFCYFFSTETCFSSRFRYFSNFINRMHLLFIFHSNKKDYIHSKIWCIFHFKYNKCNAFTVQFYKTKNKNKNQKPPKTNFVLILIGIQHTSN